MELLLNRFWHTEVTRKSEKIVAVAVHYADSWQRLIAALEVDTATLQIKKAYLDRMGLPDQMGDKRETIEDLVGVEAFLGSGPLLRKALCCIEGEIERSLFNEAVIGIIQSETFYYLERGYGTREKFEDIWRDLNAGSCRAFSNLDRLSNSWFDYIGDDPRLLNLYERYKNQQLYSSNDSPYILTGSMMDSFHQVSDFLELDEDLHIVSVLGTVMKAPYEICKESGSYMTNLAGKSLLAMTKKDIAAALGARQGCTHLIDMVSDNVKTIEIYLAKRA